MEAGKALVQLKGRPTNFSSSNQTSSSHRLEDSTSVDPKESTTAYEVVDDQRCAPYPTPLIVANQRSLIAEQTQRSERAVSPMQYLPRQATQLIAKSSSDSEPIITKTGTRIRPDNAESPTTSSDDSEPVIIRRRQKGASRGIPNIQQNANCESNPVQENVLGSSLAKRRQDMRAQVRPTKSSDSWIDVSSSEVAIHGHEPVLRESSKSSNLKDRAKKQPHKRNGKNKTFHSKKQNGSESDVSPDASVHREFLARPTGTSRRASKTGASTGPGRRRKKAEEERQTKEEFSDEDAALLLDATSDSGDSEYEDSEDEDAD